MEKEEDEAFYPDNKIAREFNPDDISINELLFENYRFAHLNLDERILRGLARSGFTNLSSIQKQSVPLGRIGVDLVLQSRSGTGKTCAYTLIALDSLLSSDNAQVLIVTPTREIAFQVSYVIKTIGAYIENLKVALVTGGFKVGRDIDDLKHAKIVIGTPGRLNQLIELNHLKTTSIRLLIMDEADKLFEEQMSEQLNALYARLPEAKQVIAVSATFPENMQEFIKNYLKDPHVIKVDEDIPFPTKNAQFYAIVPERLHAPTKISIIKKWIDNLSFDQLIIFVNNKESGQKIAADFSKSKYYRCIYLFGDLPQSERYNIFKKFHGAKCNMLVTTDLFSRGVDCQNVNIVINYDLPRDKETFLHRVGRAGRFGTNCLTLTLVESGPEESIYEQFSKSLGFKKHEMPEDFINNNPWGVLDERYRLPKLTVYQKIDRLVNSHRFRPPCRKRRPCPSIFDKGDLDYLSKEKEEELKARLERKQIKDELFEKLHGRPRRSRFMKRFGIHFIKPPYPEFPDDERERYWIDEMYKNEEYYSSTSEDSDDEIVEVPPGGWPGCCGGHILPGTQRWLSLDEDGHPIIHHPGVREYLNNQKKKLCQTLTKSNESTPSCSKD